MDEVRRLRKLRGLSQVELAERSGVSAYTITEVETGRREPHGRTLRKLAAALGVEVADLFPKAPAPPPPENGEQGDQETTAREETLRMVEEQDALLGKHMALLLDQQLQWQLERLNSRLDRAESAAARNDAARDLGSWFFSSTLWIEQVRRHYPEIWVPELVRAREAARGAVEEFAPNFTSPERHEETTRTLAGIEAATAAQDSPPTGPGRRVRFSGGRSWAEQAVDRTETEAPTKGA